MCLDCCEKRNKALGNETSPGTLRFVQAQKISRWKNITLEVEGDADRLVCEFLYENFRRAVDKRAAQGKNIRDEWNSGVADKSCERLVSS